MDENKALKKIAKMPSENEMAREVAKWELTLATEKKKQRPKFSIRNELFQKKKACIEESIDDEVEESSDEEEYIKKKKCKQRKRPKESKKKRN